MNRELFEKVADVIATEMDKHRYSPAPMPDYVSPDDLRRLVDRRICDCGVILAGSAEYQQHVQDAAAGEAVKAVGEYLLAELEEFESGCGIRAKIKKECGLS